MNTNLPISQADLEAMRIGPARAAAEMEGSWAMTVDAREPRSGTKKDFQSALMQAGLLQGRQCSADGNLRHHIKALFLRRNIFSKGDDKWQDRRQQKSDRQR